MNCKFGLSANLTQFLNFGGTLFSIKSETFLKVNISYLQKMGMYLLPHLGFYQIF